MNGLQHSFNFNRAGFFLLFFICCVLAGAVLKVASAIILPFAIAIMLAFVMYPMVKAFDKLKFPRFVSILLAIIVIIAGICILGIVIFRSGKMIFANWDKYEVRLTEIYRGVAPVFDLPFDEGLTFIENLWAQSGIRTWVRNSSFYSMNIFLQFVKGAGLVVLFVVFILVEANFFKEKLIIVFKNQDRSDRVSRMGHELMSQVTRYLGAKFLISLANGLLFAIAFYFVGLEFAIVWGVVQFILNFIPTLGSIIAGFLFTLFALLQFWPEPGPVIFIIAIVLGGNIVIGNFLDPRIIGKHVGISPLVVLVSLLLWGWIWGFTGMIVAVPMTVTIKIVCENIPFLEPVSVLIGGRKSVQAKNAREEKAETAAELAKAREGSPSAI